jgi:beta-glucosidase
MEAQDPNKPSDVRAAQRADAYFNRLFVEPALGLGYPYGEDGFPALKRIEKYFRPGDDEKVKFDFDFHGVQNYFREIVKGAWYVPFLGLLPVLAKKRNVPMTEMGWEIHPDSIYKMVKKFGAYKGVKKVYVTENGAAFPDTVVNGRVHDPQRVKYLQDFTAQVLRAKQEGVNVGGYFIWSFLDNFEWSFGYRPRFGVVHVNYDTLERTVKDSGLWVKEFLTGKE